MSPEEEGYKDLLKKFTVQCEEEHREVVGAGGLFILGTERHESRRIDNQLRGRSGRQGDPGESRFYLSLEDNLMRIFGSERIAMIMDKLGVQEDEPIEHNLISKSIEGAQKKVEGRNFEIRKHLLEYDDVMNKQREVVYAERRRILSEENLKSMVEEILDGVLDDAIETYLPRKGSIDGWDIEGFRAWVKNTFDLGIELSADKGTDREDLYRKIRANIMDYYNMREQEFSPEVMRMVERHFLLLTLDTLWKDHLLSMDHLKDGIGLRGYGQKNPLREYQREGFDMFLTTLARVKELSLERLFKVQIQRQEDVEKVSQQERRQRMHMGRGPGEKAPTIKREGKKIGRNDPCPCGSGKKYKQCCGAGT
jgi:preprotein translocase subunit SecA